MSEGVSRVFDELHLCQVRAQRLGGGRDGGNRRVSRFLGGVTGVFGRATRVLGRDPELFCLFPQRFGRLALLFGSDALEIRFLAMIFGLFPACLGLHAAQLRAGIVVGHKSPVWAPDTVCGERQPVSVLLRTRHWSRLSVKGTIMS